MCRVRISSRFGRVVPDFGLMRQNPTYEATSDVTALANNSRSRGVYTFLRTDSENKQKSDPEVVSWIFRTSEWETGYGVGLLG